MFFEASQVSVGGKSLPVCDPNNTFGPVLQAAERLRRGLDLILCEGGLVTPKGSESWDIGFGWLEVRKAVPELDKALLVAVGARTDPTSRNVQHVGMSPDLNAAGLRLWRALDALSAWLASVVVLPIVERPELPTVLLATFTGALASLKALLPPAAAVEQVEQVEPPTVAVPVADTAGEIYSRAALAIGETGGRVLQIAMSNESADERMRKICEIDAAYWGWLSPAWSKLLKVSEQAIRKTPFWTEERPKHLADARPVEAQPPRL